MPITIAFSVVWAVPYMDTAIGFAVWEATTYL